MSNFNFGWTEDRTSRQMKLSEEITKTFLEDMENAKINGIKLVKREGQEQYIKEIMSAIRDGKILAIQAGVGSGKTYGYLIPTIITTNNVEDFNKIVIATSSRALQQQILTDSHNVSKMLDIPIDVTIVKGMANYVCVERLNKIIKEESNEEIRNFLFRLRNEILVKKSTSDRDELTEVSEEIWEQIKLENRGKCSQCDYAKEGRCYYQELQKKINSDERQIIVTNQAMLSYWFKNNLIDGVDMLVIDEAHNFEDNIREILGGKLQLDLITNELLRIKNSKIEPTRNNKKLINRCINTFQDLYKEIRLSAINTFQENNPNTWIEDNQETVFRITPEIELMLSKVINNLKELSEILESKKLFITNKKISAYLLVLEDLQKGIKSETEQENFYWAKFNSYHKIELCCTRRKVSEITEFIASIPTTILTSGTIIGKDGNYTEFISSLFEDVDKIEEQIRVAPPIKSPFNYAENTMIYYDQNISMPPTKNNLKYYNEEKYIEDLVDRIDKLIRMTEGKSLILFTSIDIMNKVYKKISEKEYPFEIMLQNKEESNRIKQKFSENTNSCLFATGAFWEGIDIKGESLSNVIITRLPFPIEDAKSTLTNMYLYRMLVKLQQGFGRAVRTENDKAIISILDARTNNYLEIIQNVLPTPKENYTTDLLKVEEFVEENIVKKAK